MKEDHPSDCIYAHRPYGKGYEMCAGPWPAPGGLLRVALTGRERIDAERQRQIDVEGWSPEHDRGHHDGALLTAARYYLAAQDETAGRDASFPRKWDWKPRSRIRNLERAGALILAEYQRDAHPDITGRIHRNVWLPFLVDGIAVEIDRLLENHD